MESRTVDGSLVAVKTKFTEVRKAAKSVALSILILALDNRLNRYDKYPAVVQGHLTGFRCKFSKLCIAVGIADTSSLFKTYLHGKLESCLN